MQNNLKYSIFNDSKKYSGNNTTLDRLSKILYYPDNIIFTDKIVNNIIGIHAYKFGKKILESNNNLFPSNLNFILIIGGTDLNIDINTSEKEKIIKQTIKHAKYIVCFNEFLYNIIINRYNIENNKVKIIAQSVEKIEYIKKPAYLRQLIYNKRKIENYNKVFIMVGNVRKVKNPFFLQKVFNTVLKEKGYILVLIGNLIDDFKCKDLGNYWTDNFFNIEPCNKKELQNVYNQADGLINTSDSEGMSSSILEAMVNKCPVYARNIDGNKSIITHGENGFLFSNPKELVKLLERPTRNIIKNAEDYVKKFHNTDLEIYKYKQILEK